MERRVIAVGAGKGGVGKSTVALNLARALRAHGRVGILDLDFYGPNIPAMVGIAHERWTTSWTLASRTPPQFTPVLRENLAIASTGFILGEDQPLGVDAMTAGLIAKQLVHNVRWPQLAYLVVDLPPGTSAVQQILVKELSCAGAIVVVTPQLLAHVDGRKAVQMFRALGVRVLGGVENMAPSSCPHCSTELVVFPAAPRERSIWSMDVELLAQVPMTYDGSLDDSASPLVSRFDAIADKVVSLLNK